MDKNNILAKGSVFIIVFLFLGVCVHPAIAQNPIRSKNLVRNIVVPQIKDIDQKEYLYQTIFDISNNPDVKDLLERNDFSFTLNKDHKNTFRQIIFKNPLFFIQILFSRPKLTSNYLDSSFKTGYFMVNALGEDKAIEIRDSIINSNSELFDEVHSIIIKDEQLSNRISKLAELDFQIESPSNIIWYLVICLILLALLIPSYWAGVFFYLLAEMYKDDPLLRQAYLTIMNVITYQLIIPLGYLAKFQYNCPVE